MHRLFVCPKQRNQFWRFFLAAIAIIAACSSGKTHSAEIISPISVEQRGRGPDVILIPGLGSSAAVWDGLAASLEGHYRLHLVQIAGFAGSPAKIGSSGDLVILPVVAALHDYIKAHGLKHPAVIGHSMGGLAGLLLARDHPDDVGKLLVVDTLPFFPVLFSPTATVETVTPQAKVMRDQILASPPAAFQTMEESSIERLVKSPEGRKQVLAWTLASDRSVFSRAFYEVMTTDIRKDLPAIQTPITVFYPYDSTMGAPEAAIDQFYGSAYDTLPNVKLRHVEGSFHFIMLDQPELFSAEVAKFL